MYFKLTYHSTPVREKVGDYVVGGRGVLYIGQTPSCKLPLPEVSDAAPLVMAAILPVEGKEAWYITRKTDSYEILVNGEPLHIARSLKKGDRLTFNDGEHTTILMFDECRGDYDAATGAVYQHHAASRRINLAAIVLCIAALGVALWALVGGHRQQQDLAHADLTLYEQSIYHITTDSVELLCDTIIGGQHHTVSLERHALENSEAGTCFLTDQGLFVTARHCVEPWITDEQWDGMDWDTSMPVAVRLANLAETRNRQGGGRRYSVRAHSVVNRGAEHYEFHSTDFHFNKSRDQVLRLGTDANPIYWRTIIPLATRRDMELGDFAYVEAPAGIVGNISLATAADLHTFEQQAYKAIMAIGFPVNDNATADVISQVLGNCQHIEFGTDSLPIGCIQMSALVNKGNSGGPILAYIGEELKAIGIVSKSDARAQQGLFWAVPSTEVVTLHDIGGEMPEDTVYYRR